jgi:hypothetical protein
MRCLLDSKHSPYIVVAVCGLNWLLLQFFHENKQLNNLWATSGQAMKQVTAGSVSLEGDQAAALFESSTREVATAEI